MTEVFCKGGSSNSRSAMVVVGVVVVVLVVVMVGVMVGVVVGIVDKRIDTTFTIDHHYQYQHNIYQQAYK